MWYSVCICEREELRVKLKITSISFRSFLLLPFFISLFFCVCYWKSWFRLLALHFFIRYESSWILIHLRVCEKCQAEFNAFLLDLSSGFRLMKVETFGMDFKECICLNLRRILCYNQGYFSFLCSIKKV